MKRFADLYALVDETTKTSVKVETEAPFSGKMSREDQVVSIALVDGEPT